METGGKRMSGYSDWNYFYWYAWWSSMFPSFYLGSPFVENDLNVEDFAKLLKMGEEDKKSEQALQMKCILWPRGGSTAEQYQIAESQGFSTAPHFGDIHSDMSSCWRQIFFPPNSMFFFPKWHIKTPVCSGLHTPNICRRSGSLKRKGMLDTWRRLGVPLSSESTPAVPPPPPPPEPTPDWPSSWEDPSDCW